MQEIKLNILHVLKFEFMLIDGSDWQLWKPVFFFYV